MANNWQVLDMFQGLQEIFHHWSEEREKISAKELSTMTALELLELLAPNDVRFCIEKHDGVIRKYREGKKPTFAARTELGPNLWLHYNPNQKEFTINVQGIHPIGISCDEMEKLVAFVESLK